LCMKETKGRRTVPLPSKRTEGIVSAYFLLVFLILTSLIEILTLNDASRLKSMLNMQIHNEYLAVEAKVTHTVKCTLLQVKEKREEAEEESEENTADETDEWDDDDNNEEEEDEIIIPDVPGVTCTGEVYEDMITVIITEPVYEELLYTFDEESMELMEMKVVYRDVQEVY